MKKYVENLEESIETSQNRIWIETQSKVLELAKRQLVVKVDALRGDDEEREERARIEREEENERLIEQERALVRETMSERCRRVAEKEVMGTEEERQRWVR